MRKLVMAGVLASACGGLEDRTIPVSPGLAEVFIPNSLFLGEPTHGHMRWPNASSCNFDDWFCRTPPGLTMTVLGLTCHGCNILVDPTGITTLGITDFTVVATTDGPISVEAWMRFDATGKETRVSAFGTGDHEVALEARCGLIDSHVLASAAAAGSPYFEGDQIRACGSTRTSSEVIVIFLQIRTFHGMLRFPFCSNPDYCSGAWGEPLRPRDEIAFPRAPELWGSCTEFAGSGPRGSYSFAAFPSVGSIETMDVSAPRLDGGTFSASVAIPALSATPGDCPGVIGRFPARQAGAMRWEGAGSRASGPQPRAPT
jgi:hypothetical protein